VFLVRSMCTPAALAVKRMRVVNEAARLRGVELQVPAFTGLCMAVGPIVVIGLIALATVNCVWVWLRKAEARPSWVGFLATATGSLFLATLPVVLALYLHLVNALQKLAAK